MLVGQRTLCGKTLAHPLSPPTKPSSSLIKCGCLGRGDREKLQKLLKLPCTRLKLWLLIRESLCLCASVPDSGTLDLVHSWLHQCSMNTVCSKAVVPNVLPSMALHIRASSLGGQRCLSCALWLAGTCDRALEHATLKNKLRRLSESPYPADSQSHRRNSGRQLGISLFDPN